MIICSTATHVNRGGKTSPVLYDRLHSFFFNVLRSPHFPLRPWLRMKWQQIPVVLSNRMISTEYTGVFLLSVLYKF